MTSTNPCLIQDIHKSISHTRHPQIHISYKTSTKTLDHHKHNTEYKSTYDPPDPAVATRSPHPQTHATDTIQSPTSHSNTQYTPSGTPVASSHSSPCPSSRGTACPRCLTRSILRLTPTPHSHLRATDCRCHCAPHASSSRDNSSRSVVPSAVGADRTPSSRSLRSPHRNPTRSPADCSHPHADRHPHRTTTPPNPPSCTPPSPPRR